MKMEIEMVKKKIYHDIVINKQETVYDPDKFREFCILAGATKLFDTILGSITSFRHSADRTCLNKKRVVSFIYNLCYCLSQTCNPLQIDHALYLRSNQINQEGIETEHIMGHTLARRTVNNVVNTMSESHFKSFEDFITEATERKWLIVLIVDDFTSIHTKKWPQKDQPSEAKTMCTIVVKAYKEIPAIEVEQATRIHDPNGIDIESCQQLITSASCMHDISNSYASVMPDWLTESFFNPELERQRINIHQYCDNDNVRTMRKMDDLHLVDFIELRLKSKADFEAAYDVIMSTGLAAYMKKFLVFQPGDWPCQFYSRQIIYESLKKFVSSHPVLTTTLDEHDNILTDHSSYSFPLPTATAEHPLDNSLPQNTSQPSILSVVPTIGPLHISLNSREHVVNSYHSFFKTVYEAIFPRSKLADHPKPWRISLILEIVYGGWTLVRHTVMRKFSRFKDVEYGTLYNLLDNYIPLVLSIYSISFKLNNFPEYFSAMIRIWIMFTCLQRRHYNKAPLIWINMCSHWGKYAPQMYNLLTNYITIFDEYPVENTHSILRSQTKGSDTADELRKKAKSIFQSKDKQSHFRSFFTTPKQFSFSHNQLRFLKVRCAQVLSSMFSKISRSPGQSLFSSTNRSNRSPTHVTLPTMSGSNNRMKTIVLPLGYHGEIKPDQSKQCDLPACNISTQDEDWTLLHGCFHSFHNDCLNGSTSCPLCKDFLKEKVKDLGEIAKKAILNPASTTHVPETQINDSGEALTDNSPNEISGLREIESEEFDSIIRELNDELDNLNPATQPFTNSNQTPVNSTSAASPNKAPPHCRKCHHPVRGHKRLNNRPLVKCNFCENSICSASTDTSFSKCPCSWHTSHQANQGTCNSQSATSQRPATVNISVTKKLHLDVTEWLMPSYICQSSVGGGLSGSNACTVIAVLTGLHFLEETLPIPKQLQDLNLVIPLYVNLMMKGNQIYQSFQLPAQQPNLEVRQVLQQHNHEQFQKLEIIADLGFFSVQDLDDHITQHHHQHPRFAAVLIVPPDKSMVLCFDYTTISLFESHRHGLQGGLIATSSTGNISNFIRYLTRMVMRDWGAQLQGSNMAILGLK